MMLFWLLLVLFFQSNAAQKRVLITNNFTWANLAWGFPNGGKDTTTGMKVIDLDIDEQHDLIPNFRSEGHIVMCYFSAGTLEPWRPDCKANKTLWESAAVGKMKHWDEEWLDVRKFDLLKQLMSPRFYKAVKYGCHAIEPDNTDCYDNESCWSKMGYTSGSKVKPFQITYNVWLTQIAHANGLSIALKNTLGLMGDIGSHFDCAVNEQCQTYNECDGYDTYASQDKGIFQVEYNERASFCEGGKKYSMKTKYCPEGTSDGLCAATGSWTDCFSPTVPLPPTHWTN